MPDAELRETFVPRRIYGDYIRGLAVHYLFPGHPRSEVEFQLVDDMAVDVRHNEEQGGVVVVLQSGDSIAADSVLLATGNQPPMPLPGQAALTRDSRYCSDPWRDWYEDLPEPDGHIVLLGTGLTMVDVMVTLRELDWSGRVTAISRNGMLPRAHFRGIAYPDFLPDDISQLNLPQLVSVIEQHCERLRQIAQNPAIAVDKLRPRTQELWRNLSTQDKRNFLDRYAARWNVVRHRIAESIHERVTDALDCGQLTIVASTITSIASREDGIEVQLQSENGNSKPVTGDLVINCTGPQSQFSNTDLPLVRNLLERGLVSTDELDMGIEVNSDFAVVNSEGAASRCLYAIGPLLRGSLWETTAVPELRGQAMRVAQIMLEQEPITTEEEYVIEYCI